MKRHSVTVRWLSLVVMAVLLFSSSGSALSQVLAVTFSGDVLYTSGLGAPLGQPGVTIQVYGLLSTRPGYSLLGSVQTGRSGHWTFTDTTPDISGYKIVKTDPRGMIPAFASAPEGSTVLDVSSVFVNASTDGITFTLQDPQIGQPVYHDRYLVVTKANLVPALEKFVNYKRGLGFDMIVKTVEELSEDLTIGNPLRFAIRDYEKQLKSEPAGLKYVLLVGSNNTIPFMTYNPAGLDLIRSNFPAGCTDPNGANIPVANNNCGWAGDWFYTDLYSNWDSNGDGVLGEAYWADPNDKALLEYMQTHPSYTPDASPAYHPDVYLGRLMMDSDYEVKTALDTIMRFERDGGAWKENTLLAGAMMNYNGKTYDFTKQFYKSLGPKEDTAVLNERLWQDILQPAGMSRLTTYEKAHPTNISDPPNNYPVDAALSWQNMVSLWKAHDLGFVNASGHGNQWGIYRMWWNVDYEQFGTVENPNSYQELELAEEPYLANSLTGSLNSPNQNAPVLISLACSTGSWTDPSNFGTTLLENGRISAWTGETSTGVFRAGWKSPADGRGQTITYNIVQGLFSQNLPLGDAVWQGLEKYYQDTSGPAWNYTTWDWGFINWDLFGDPSMRYWGAGVDTKAYWPVYHADWPGNGASSLVGPGMFSGVKWSGVIDALNGTTQNASPVIGADGTVYIGDGSGQVRAFAGNGTLRWTYPGASPIYTAPAVGADGRIFVKTVNHMLALNADGSLYWDTVVGTSSGSPKFGRDGLIYVGGSDKLGPGGTNRYFLASFTPGGAEKVLSFVDSEITSAVSAAKDGSIWFGTKNGTLCRYRPYYTLACVALSPGYSIGHGLALRDNNDPMLFVPTAKGELIAWNVNSGTVRWTWTNPSGVSAIWGAPAFAFNAGNGLAKTGEGKVIFGSQDGRVRALRASDGSPIWENNLVGPVASAPALDPTRVYVTGGSPNGLYILNRADGSLESLLPFDGPAVGSSPAIGPSSTLYAGAVQDGTTFLSAFAPATWLLAPEIEYAIPDYQSIILGFSTDLDHYIQVEVRDPGGAWHVEGYLAPGQAEYTITNKPGKQEIRALTMAGIPIFAGQPAAPANAAALADEDSDYTPILAVTPLPDPPAAPTGLAVQALSSSKLRLTWSALPAGVAGLTVLRKAPGEMVFTPFTNLPANSSAWVDAGLLPASQYDYELRASNSGGQSPGSGAAQGMTLAETLPAPSAVQVTLLSDTTFRICWTPGRADLKTMVGRQPLGQASADILAALPAGVACYDDTTAFSYQFTYWLKHVNAEGTLESRWVTSDIVRAATFVFTQPLYLPLLRR